MTNISCFSKVLLTFNISLSVPVAGFLRLFKSLKIAKSKYNFRDLFLFVVNIIDQLVNSGWRLLTCEGSRGRGMMHIICGSVKSKGVSRARSWTLAARYRQWSFLNVLRMREICSLPSGRTDPIRGWVLLRPVEIQHRMHSQISLWYNGPDYCLAVLNNARFSRDRTGQLLATSASQANTIVVSHPTGSSHSQHIYPRHLPLRYSSDYEVGRPLSHPLSLSPSI